MPLLSRDQQESYCAQNLRWAQTLLRNKFGPDAEQYAGEGLVEALRTWDGERNFKRWAAITCYNVARRGYVQHHGRPGRGRPTSAISLEATEAADWLGGDAPGPDRRLIEDEELLEALYTIDRMEVDRTRWALLGRLLGSYNTVEAKTVANTPDGPANQFRNVDELVDALMLAGARIERSGSERTTPRLVIERSRQACQALPWLIMLAERGGLLRCSITSGLDRIRERVRYKTRANWFLRHGHERWYSRHQTAAVPDDLTLTEPMLVSWAVSGFSGMRGGETAVFTAPNLPRKGAARLRKQCRALGWPTLLVLNAHRDSWGLRVPETQRSEAEQWLLQRVPSCVWRNETRGGGDGDDDP